MLQLLRVLNLDFSNNDLLALADLASLHEIDLSGSQSSDVMSEQTFADLMYSSALKRPDVQFQMHNVQHYQQLIKLYIWTYTAVVSKISFDEIGSDQVPTNRIVALGKLPGSEGDYGQTAEHRQYFVSVAG